VFHHSATAIDQLFVTAIQLEIDPSLALPVSFTYLEPKELTNSRLGSNLAIPVSLTYPVMFTISLSRSQWLDYELIVSPECYRH
jgi:hypothetical protein